MQRKFIFNGGYSTRFHTIDVHTRQCIGNHSFGVAWYCELLTEGQASKNLIMAALSHDLAEHLVGDIPSPAKRALGISAMYQEFEDKHLAEVDLLKYSAILTPKEVVILKFADMLEGMTFCIRERKFGNQNVEIIFDRFSSYVSELIDRNHLVMTDKIVQIIEDVENEWKEIANVKSKRTSGSGVSLQSNVPALGLGAEYAAPVPPLRLYQVPDSLEEEEWASGSRESITLP